MNVLGQGVLHRLVPDRLIPPTSAEVALRQLSRASSSADSARQIGSKHSNTRPEDSDDESLEHQVYRNDCQPETLRVVRFGQKLPGQLTNSAGSLSRHTGSANSLSLHTGSSASLYEPSEVTEAKTQAWFYLVWLLSSVAFYTLGISLPLVEIRAFPQSSLEIKKVLSVFGAISDLVMHEYYMAAAALVFCDVAVPFLKFAGMSTIVWDKFFAVGYSWATGLSKSTHTMLVSAMYVCSSYQMLDMFIIVLSLAFMCTGGTSVLLEGFYFFAFYCVSSVAMLQSMESLIEHTSIGGSVEIHAPTIEALTPVAMGHRVTAFVPSLPGMKHIVAVDTVHVFLFAPLSLGLLCLIFTQPLLDVRFLLGGVAMDRKLLSIRDMLYNGGSGASTVNTVGFFVFVLLIPTLYNMVVATAGLLDYLASRERGPSRHADIVRQLLWITDVLRPWVMTDVFALALLAFLFVVQSENVIAGVPREAFFLQAWERRSVDPLTLENYLLSGTSLMVGAGLSVFYLRWYWSASQNQDAKVKIVETSDSDEQGHDHEDASPLAAWCHLLIQVLCSKFVGCVLIWLLLGLGMFWMSPTLPCFQVREINMVLNDTVPMLNSFIEQYSPASYGQCGSAPTPCLDGPVLYETIEHNGATDRLINASWVSGLNTALLMAMQIVQKPMTTTAGAVASQMGREFHAQGGPAMGVVAGVMPNDGLHNKSFANVPGSRSTIRPASWPLAVADTRLYSLTLTGVLQQVGLFLHVLDCPAGAGPGPNCSTLLNTSSVCCEANRSFRISIAADCHVGDHVLSRLRVQVVDIDTLTVVPTIETQIVLPGGLGLGSVRVDLPTQDISPSVESQVKSRLAGLLTTDRWIYFGKSAFNMQDLINRVLRFNNFIC